MICDCCKKNEAKVQVCDVEQNAVVQQFAICNDCMTLLKRLLFDPATPLIPTSEAVKQVQDMLSSKDKSLTPVEAPGKLTVSDRQPEAVPACPSCGMTLAEFKQRGRFGCAHDYEVFASHIDPLLERIHDVTPPQHRGRLPQGEADESVTGKARELAALRNQLDDAVLAEDYERAAKLRDRIAALAGEVKSKPGKARREGP
ncbi:MAG: hypothetical protein DCC64_03295 [Planctomycetota bacterium]|nr:MAG: hypothetical protein DCC64_03295 [Planctomycetota bacterium]